MSVGKSNKKEALVGYYFDDNLMRSVKGDSSLRDSVYTRERSYNIVDENMEQVPMDGATQGEIVMRGNTVMKGYLKNPEATEASFKGGYFHSGDIAVQHPNTYIQIADRAKDIIISGGENISSVEVEGTLMGHPDVNLCAVVARPDEKWGETPCAFVTVTSDGADLTQDDVIAFCRDNMAHFKAPRTVIFGDLPKTQTGKIQKFVLRERAKAL